MNTFNNKEVDVATLKRKTKDDLIFEIEKITSEFNNLGWKENDAQILIRKQESVIDGLNTVNKMLKGRLSYWIADFSEQKQSYINLCVSTDLGLLTSEG